MSDYRRQELPDRIEGCSWEGHNGPLAISRSGMVYEGPYAVGTADDLPLSERRALAKEMRRRWKRFSR